MAVATTARIHAGVHGSARSVMAVIASVHYGTEGRRLLLVLIMVQRGGGYY